MLCTPLAMGLRDEKSPFIHLSLTACRAMRGGLGRKESGRWNCMPWSDRSASVRSLLCGSEWKWGAGVGGKTQMEWWRWAMRGRGQNAKARQDCRLWRDRESNVTWNKTNKDDKWCKWRRKGSLSITCDGCEAALLSELLFIFLKQIQWFSSEAAHLIKCFIFTKKRVKES